MKSITVAELKALLARHPDDAPVKLVTTHEPALGCTTSEIRRPPLEVDQNGTVFILGEDVD
jgi:hypothetical protein